MSKRKAQRANPMIGCKHNHLRHNGVAAHSKSVKKHTSLSDTTAMTTRDNYPPATWPALPTIELPSALDFLKLKNFPLKVYPAVYDRPKLQNDTLYIHGPGWRKSSASFDVDCLQIQARSMALFLCTWLCLSLTREDGTMCSFYYVHIDISQILWDQL